MIFPSSYMYIDSSIFRTSWNQIIEHSSDPVKDLELVVIESSIPIIVKAEISKREREGKCEEWYV